MTQENIKLLSSENCGLTRMHPIMIPFYFYFLYSLNRVKTKSGKMQKLNTNAISFVWRKKQERERERKQKREARNERPLLMSPLSWQLPASPLYSCLVVIALFLSSFFLLLIISFTRTRAIQSRTAYCKPVGRTPSVMPQCELGIELLFSTVSCCLLSTYAL